MPEKVIIMNRILIASLFVFLIVPEQIKAAQSKVAPVVTVKVIEKKLKTRQTYVGTIYPVKKSVVGSAVDGRVAEFPINEGEFIKKGKPLAKLLTRTISLDVVAAKAELILKKEELKELENGSREEDIKRAKALMLAAKTVNDYQQNRLKRMEMLYRKQTINEDELQKSRSDSIKTNYVYQETLSSFNLMNEGPRPEKIAQARARVSYQQAIVNNLEDKLKKYTIVAPFDGYIIKEHTELGEWVNRGDLIAEVIALNEVNIVIQVLDTQISHVKLGVPVIVEIPAARNQKFKGVIGRIIPQADIRSRTFPVIVRLKNKISKDGPLMKSGMMVRTSIPNGPEKMALLVPKDALVLSKNRPVVMVVDLNSKGSKTGIVRPVPVQYGIESGEWIEVTGKIKKGEQVVVRGNERLRKDQEVVITEMLKVPEVSQKSN